MVHHLLRKVVLPPSKIQRRVSVTKASSPAKETAVNSATSPNTPGRSGPNSPDFIPFEENKPLDLIPFEQNKPLALVPFEQNKPLSLIPFDKNKPLPRLPIEEKKDEVPDKCSGKCNQCQRACLKAFNNLEREIADSKQGLKNSKKANVEKKLDEHIRNFDYSRLFNKTVQKPKMAEATEATGSSLEGRISKPAQDPKDADASKPDLGGDGAGDALGGSALQEPDYSVEVKLSDLQADPHNPLYSVKTFEDLGLDDRILKGLTSMNFRKPSKVQERALPLLMANPPTNLVGQSQSGTGKTAAFVLNILSRIDLSNAQAQNTPQAMILAPTRELARQIVGVIQIMGQYLENLIIGTAVPMDPANRPQRLNCSVVVGTPGTVQEMIKKRILNPTQLKVLVLDEADNMLDLQGLGDQCIRVKGMLPKTIQVVLFSATFPTHVYRYAQTFAPNANEITLKHDELTVEGIKQLYMDCDNEEEKYRNLVQLYGLLTVGSSIIFVRTRDSAREIERRMVEEGHTVASLTGGVEGSQRDAVIDAFRSGEAKVLITTNVLARGIDVSTVSLVVNYDIPEEHDQSRSVPKQLRPDYQTYLHRIGRTGRFGRIGVAITFVANREEWEMLRMIQEHFCCQIDRIDTSDWDEVEEIIKKTIKNSRAQAKFSF